ncbi:MAG TPA: flagellar brake protein [Clostridium sp.]|nr:flagellar brake protein [Clostridium sp.]
MNFDQLKLGMKVEMVLSDEEESPKFVSQFEGTCSDGIYYVSAPIYEGKIYPIAIGTKLDMYFVEKENFYKFRAKVLDRSRKAAISLLKIEALDEIKKIQRRGFFRFECMIPINYKVVKSSKTNFNKDEGFKKTITRDLSGGGTCIKLTEKLNVGDIIECEMLLSDFDKVSFLGKIVRIIECEIDKGIYKYEAGVLFQKIDDKSREKVISYIFQEQRKLIKKG